jgi:SAM-dependent methyltransferase
VLKLETYTAEYCATPEYQALHDFLYHAEGQQPVRTWEYPWAWRQIEGLEDPFAALDAGAWPTYFSAALAKRFEEAYAIDSYEWAARPELKGLPTGEEWSKALRREWVITAQMDLTNLRFGEGMFDAVFCLSVLEHIPDDRRALSELLRVTAPGGRVIVTTDICAGGRDYFNYGRFYAPEQLAALVRDVTGETLELPERLECLPGLDYTVGGFVVQR